MSAIRPEGLVVHECEADRRRAMARCQAWLNVVAYLLRACLGPGAGSTQVVPFDTSASRVRFRHV
jgi:hypothetical protein